MHVFDSEKVWHKFVKPDYSEYFESFVLTHFLLLSARLKESGETKSETGREGLSITSNSFNRLAETDVAVNDCDVKVTPFLD